MTEYVTGPDGQPVMRPTPLQVPASMVKIGDEFLGFPVTISEPQTDFIWRLQGWTVSEDAGFVTEITNDWPVAIIRMVPLEIDQCYECGRRNVKYVARNQCARCYQRERRGTARERLSA